MKCEIVLKRRKVQGAVCFELPAEMYRERLRRVLEACRDRNNDFVLCTFSTPRRMRTLNQNAKFHAMLGEYALETGNTLADMKEGIKFLAVEERGYPARRVKLKDGREVVVPKSTADATTEEMSLLIEQLIQTAAEDGYIFREV